MYICVVEIYYDTHTIRWSTPLRLQDDFQRPTLHGNNQRDRKRNYMSALGHPVTWIHECKYTVHMCTFISRAFRETIRMTLGVCVFFFGKGKTHDLMNRSDALPTELSGDLMSRASDF